MNNEFRYKLETPRITGRRQQKYVCPHCSRRSLVRYVDTYDGNNYVADVVGKCDHLHSCGYHYKPREYYEDNKWLKEKVVRYQQPNPLPPPLPLLPLSMELVEQFHSPESTFWKWLTTKCAEKLGLKAERLQKVFEDYYIGADERANIIWWQIDEKGRLRTGHIMQFHADGHRHDGYQNWVHDTLKKQGKLSKEWTLYQCFFGAHLLPLRPQAHVAIVESEKTAIVMAAMFPQYIWLATGSCNGLTNEKLECLKGRRVCVFPDAGWYDDWSSKMKASGHDNYTMANIESYPTNSDIVDILLCEVKPLSEK